MKIFTISLTLLLILWNNIAHSQTHDIKINPLILSFRAYNVSYQYKNPLNRWAIQLSGISFHEGFFIDTRTKGTQLTLDYKRYFPNKKSYLAPYIRYQNVVFRDNEEGIKHTHPGLGLIVGREFHPFKVRWWIMDAYIGVNHISRKYRLLEGEEPINMDVPITMYGTNVRIGVTTGVRF